MNKTITTWLITAVVLLLSNGIGYAQTDACETFYQENIQHPTSSTADGAWAFTAIYGAANQTGCILGTKDTTGITPIYKELHGTPNLDRLTVNTKVQQIFDLVLADLAALASGNCSETNQSACLIERQRQEILRLHTLLENPLEDPKSPLLTQNNWVVKADGRQLIIGDDFNLSEFVEGQCSVSLANAECQSAILLAAKLIRSGEAMLQIVTHHRGPIIGQNGTFLSTRERAWNQYFNEISVQWPWELGANSWLYAEDLIQDESASFPMPPDSKHIILHPSAGFEYIEPPSQNGSLEACVLLEVVGYEAWQWEKGEAKNRWGGSLVVSLADIQGMDSVGYGAVLHTPIKNTAIGVIWRDGDEGSETGVFVNINLANIIMEYKDKDLADFVGQ